MHSWQLGAFSLPTQLPSITPNVLIRTPVSGLQSGRRSSDPYPTLLPIPDKWNIRCPRRLAHAGNSSGITAVPLETGQEKSWLFMQCNEQAGALTKKNFSQLLKLLALHAWAGSVEQDSGGQRLPEKKAEPSEIKGPSILHMAAPAPLLAAV